MTEENHTAPKTQPDQEPDNEPQAGPELLDEDLFIILQEGGQPDHTTPKPEPDRESGNEPEVGPELPDEDLFIPFMKFLTQDDIRDEFLKKAQPASDEDSEA